MSKELYIYLWKERLRKCTLPFAMVILFIVIGYFFYVPPKSTYSLVAGEVTGLRAGYGVGSPLVLTVRLDSGKDVLVKVRYSGHYYKKGERVSLSKRSSINSGIPEYYFQGYENN